MNVLEIGIVVIAWLGVLSAIVATCAAAGRADRSDASLRDRRMAHRQ
jgi:uncharacterized phage protein gp47/JayE